MDTNGYKWSITFGGNCDVCVSVASFCPDRTSKESWTKVSRAFWSCTRLGMHECWGCCDMLQPKIDILYVQLHTYHAHFIQNHTFSISYIYICVCILIGVCVCVIIVIYLHTCTCMCVQMYMHIYIYSYFWQHQFQSIYS